MATTRKVAYIHKALGLYHAADYMNGMTILSGPGWPTVGAALRAVAAQGYTHHHVSTWRDSAAKAIPKRYR